MSSSRKRQNDAKANGIDMLLQDHETMRGLFDQFLGASNDRAMQKQVIGEILEELNAHALIEEKIFYPEATKLVPDLGASTLKAEEAHHVVHLLIAELSSMSGQEKRFEAKTKVLIDSVLAHMLEEENEYLPKVRQTVSEDQLEEMGSRMAALKADAKKET